MTKIIKFVYLLILFIFLFLVLPEASAAIARSIRCKEDFQCLFYICTAPYVGKCVDRRCYCRPPLEDW
ncbi:unnamed protein product [Trifolium pratense]|uniref:Uncharacterized protein n=1 Tax=Trifolium pratense TaxID=57577 RepID=A0ACB0KFH5_TRIPR|nr:unnamed protein product [Trifolium pratense]